MGRQARPVRTRRTPLGPRRLLVIVHPGQLDEYFHICEHVGGTKVAIEMTKALGRAIEDAVDEASSVIVLDDSGADLGDKSAARKHLFWLLGMRDRLIRVRKIAHDLSTYTGSYEPTNMRHFSQAVREADADEAGIAGLWASKLFRADVDVVADLTRKAGCPARRLDAACGWDHTAWTADYLADLDEEGVPWL